MNNDYLKEKYTPHWAASLNAGDIVYATIRHETDGSLNRHNVRIVVVGVYDNTILGSDGNEVVDIPFNELSPLIKSSN